MELDPLAQAQRILLHKSTAYKAIQPKPRWIVFLVLVSILVAGILLPFSIGMALLSLAFLNYLILLSFRLSNVEKPSRAKELFSLQAIPSISISILLPLKNEGMVIKETIEAIRAQDYPESLLELIIIIEETDKYTKSSLANILLPSFAHIIEIPSLNPFTKGRALLYGLRESHHQVITVFDAESHPEPLQFRKASSLLNEDMDKFCIQSKVRISNKNQNWITRNFATEYFEWFNQYLQELSNKNLNFGLGGNSFYISKRNLIRCGSWDPFNVTEDAELSVRLIQCGIKLKLMDSYTEESCPDSMRNWLLQRTRWDKGLLVTQLVHLFPSFNSPGFSLKYWISFWLRMVAGSILPFFNLYVFIYFLKTWFSPRVAFYADLGMWTLMGVSISFMVLLNTISFSRLKISKNPISLVLGVCGYILLHILAGFLAYYEYFLNPLKWNNTRHE